ncbi:protein kinase UbiB [uncultured archaeon]|nr:protein kinase UbiB [uncultured archaeon]
MDPFGIGAKTRSAQRLREILAVLASSGFGYMVARMRLSHQLPLLDRLSTTEPDLSEVDLPVRSREVLAQLGPTFIKFGQILSTRPDLVGSEFSEELSKLQDKVPPFPYEEVKGIIESDLGKPIPALFKSFDKKPFASASIGQVHRAVLKSGEEVVVKVRRPRIVEQVREDVQIMRFLASQLSAHSPESRSIHLPSIITEFERAINRELDYRREVRYAQQFAEFFKSDSAIHIPRVHAGLCSEQVLVMEYVHAPSLQDIFSARKTVRHLNKRLVARRLVDAYFRQVMVSGLFHADPHPSNILLLPKNRICFLDFGMVGRIEPALMTDLMHCFALIIRYDVDGLLRQFDYMNLLDENVDRRVLRYDVLDLMESYYGAELAELDIGALFSRLIELMRRHHLRVPREFVMLGRSMLIIEGDAVRLDPRFNVLAVLTPYAEQAVVRRTPKLKSVSALLGEYLIDFSRFAHDLPSDLRHLVHTLQSGRLKLEFEHKNLDVFTRDLERIGNKLSVALLAAALIMGSSMLAAAVGGGPAILGLPLSVVGFGLSALLFLWLTISIIRQ